MQMYMSKPRLSVVTAAWANRPSASVAGALFFASDVGEYGTLFQATGTRWRPVNGKASLKTVAAAGVVGIANVETISLQALIPAGVLQAGDTIRLSNLGLTKSGTTDTGSMTVRIGAAGTTGDTAITGLTTYSIMAAASQNFGGVYDIRVVSATSVQKSGNAGSQTSAFSGPSTAASPAATAITDASANDLYVSVGFLSSGATNTLSLLAGQIELVTP